LHWGFSIGGIDSTLGSSAFEKQLKKETILEYIFLEQLPTDPNDKISYFSKKKRTGMK